MLRFEDLRVRDQQTLDRDFFNRRFRLIAETISKLGTGLDSVNDATDNLVALGLVRVNEVLGPLLAKVQAASENGFLVARSSTPLTLAVGLETTLAIADTAQRDLFTPTPYVLISRDADEAANDWAILRVQGYNRDNGGLAFEVVALNGDIGATAHDDWVVSATTGVAPAIMEAAAQVTQLVATAESASTLAQQAAASAAQVLATGPVTSVNGRSGVVTIAMSDIAGLVAAIAAKADSNHGHSIAQISNLQTTLTTLEEVAANPDGGVY